jgi:hypothetical protein
MHIRLHSNQEVRKFQRMCILEYVNSIKLLYDDRIYLLFAAHINHIRAIAGVNHVGLGAGYDGINL